MERQEMLNELMELILDSDPKESSFAAFYEQVLPRIRPLAAWHHVAKMCLKTETEPNIYEIRGGQDQIETLFHPEVGDQPLTLEFSKQVNTVNRVWIWPYKDHRFTPQEERIISAVVKLLNTAYVRTRMMDRQQRAPYLDQLTGLYNNSGVLYYGAALEQNCDMGEYAGCYLNLKNVKYVNQHLTNQGGDAVMRQYAYRLYDLLDPKWELMARLGGDNFFALVKKDHLGEFLENALQQNVTVQVRDREHQLPMSAWVGVYNAKTGDQVSAILNNSSFAYDQAKKTCVSMTYFDQALALEALRAKQVALRLPQALKNREFVAFYQPKVNASTGELYGCEAPVRWVRDGRRVPPAQFVPVAEESGLIVELDLYMLDQVCQDLRRWLDGGIRPVCVSINYSQRDFFEDNLVERTLSTIEKYNIPPQYIEIEITETAFLDNLQLLEGFITAMHEHGIRVSLDDFGTGYSSINMFKNLDLDTVKLDRSFFENLGDQRERDQVVLRSVAEMLNRLHRTTVSEGVETLEQTRFSVEIGCPIIQGFFFDRPLNRQEFTLRLLSRRYRQDGTWVRAEMSV